MDDIKSSKKFQNFFCEICNYTTSRNSQYDRHLTTSKHKRMTQELQNDDKKSSTDDILVQENKSLLLCICGKKYKYRQGLWKHKLTCEKENIKKLNESGIQPDVDDGEKMIENTEANTTLLTSICDKDIIIMLIKQNTDLIKDNSEFKKIMAEQSAAMIEIAKNSCNQSHNNNNNNNNNKTFNLQFFLNETCKNAMNIDEFINRLKIEVEDLENMGNVGYVQGISSIINKNMNTLDVTERPIHCTDLKRGTIHIKDNNVWEKDDQENTMTRKAISKISTKTILSMKKFREKYPDCESSNSRHSNKYNRICREACGGEGDNVVEKDNKIIHNIIKKVVVEKIKDE